MFVTGVLMYLLELTCKGFRGLEPLRFQPRRGLNVICGDNAQGKTSLLEALLYLTTSKSHRTSSEADLVHHGAEGINLRCRVRRADRDVLIEAAWYNGVKRFKVNGVAQERMSELLGKANVVLFSTEDTALIKAGASHRRRFMDMELSQLSPGYLAALQQYRQVLRQRNELLRQPPVEPALLAVWDEQLARHGAVLIRERAAFVEEVGQLAAKAYARIAEGEGLDIRYAPNVAAPGDLAAVWKDTRQADLRRGMTTRGPHLDDMAVAVAGRTARQFASQGQQKTAALSLRLAEMALVRIRTDEYPILMLDEVLSELDPGRAKRPSDSRFNVLPIDAVITGWRTLRLVADVPM